MKKHDEGYTLLLVVVVLLVLGIVSAALMSMTVTNLKNQRNSVNRMKEKYSAQGELEIITAQLEAQIETKLSENPDGFTITVEPANVEDGESTSKVAVEKWLEEGLQLQNGAFENDTFQIAEPVVSDEETEFYCDISFTVQSESGKTQISCGLRLSGNLKDITETEDSDEGSGEGERDSSEESVSPEFGNKNFGILFDSLEYTSYDIMDIEGGGE